MICCVGPQTGAALDCGTTRIPRNRNHAETELRHSSPRRRDSRGGSVPPRASAQRGCDHNRAKWTTLRGRARSSHARSVPVTIRGVMTSVRDKLAACAVPAHAHVPSNWVGPNGIPTLCERLVDRLRVNGSRQVIFGSNYPIDRAHHGAGRLDELGLSPATRAPLLGGNAQRVYGIGA